MMNPIRTTWKRLLASLCAVSLLGAAAVAAAADAERAMNAPDEFSWRLFMQVNTIVPGPKRLALFETWASDHDTFQPNPPPWATARAPLALRERALRSAPPAANARAARLFVVPGATTDEPSEETRRNEPAYTFIVRNNLYKLSGLQAAFAAGKTLTFPIDAVEVKANWSPVLSARDPTKSGIPGYKGSVADTAKVYHVSTASDGKQYALVAMHVISKAVPNWTWATFEHENNIARCDILGCKDSFGAATPWVPPNPGVGTGYPACTKTAAWNQMFGNSASNPAMAHYCLKGSQVDFTTATGQVIRLGNSITESGFVNQSSCMSCHGRAAFDANGKATTQAGFDPLTQLAPLGPVQASWFHASQSADPPYYPIFEGQKDVALVAMAVDFVWSIPFCAIDDSTTPPKPSRCSKK